jgi:hypothetical protein
MVNMINPSSSQILPDLFPIHSVLNAEGRESGPVRSPKTEEPKSEINLQKLVMSVNDMRRLFLIMLPGKVFISEEKGQIVDTKF